MKVCIRCNVERDLKDFRERRNVCRVCRNKAQNERYVSKPFDDSYDIKTVLRDGVEVEHKKCKVCLTSLPVESFHKIASCRQGLSPKCKYCMGYKGIYSHAKVINTTVNGESVEAKSCSKCMKIKPLDDFRIRLGREHQKVGSRLSYCKECESKVGKTKRLSETEEQRKTRQQRERIFEKGYRGRRIELYHQNKESHKFLSKIKDAKRWARKSNLRNDFSTEDHTETLAFFNESCAISGATDDITLDHFIPLWTGHGGSYKGNLYPLSGTLNYSKQHVNPFKWVERDYIKKEIEPEKWDTLLNYLASLNNLTKEQYEDYVHWCFTNRREAENITPSNRDSVKEFHKSKRASKGETG